jgi:hypothetical protein
LVLNSVESALALASFPLVATPPAAFSPYERNINALPDLLQGCEFKGTISAKGKPQKPLKIYHNCVLCLFFGHIVAGAGVVTAVF